MNIKTLQDGESSSSSQVTTITTIDMTASLYKKNY